MSRPLHAVVTSCLVRNDQGDILMIRHPQRGWELPQGHVEHGEDLLTAAAREVFEETGYQVRIEQLGAVFSKLDPQPSAIIFGFLCRLTGGEKTLSDESLEIDWFAAEEARQRPEHPVNRHRLATLLDRNGGLICQAYRMSPFAASEKLELG
jgi:8-oxo-dGTP diphosphatase